MAEKVIGNYSAANSIDGAAHYLLIQPGNASTAYNKINRNVLLGVTGQPADLTSGQGFSNKVLDNTNVITIKDNLFTLQDGGDVTRQAQFQLSSITAGQTRIYTLPDATSTLANLTSTQTLTNKTLTAPVINNGSITGTTITNDAIVGQTSATSGTIYGLSIASGKVGTNGVVTASITDGSVTPAKIISGSGNTWVWQSWSPTITGYSSNPTGTSYTYTQIGKTVILQISESTNGTSNATSKTYSLPVTARTLSNAAWNGTARVIDNGSIVATATLVQILSAGTILSIFATGGGSVWTASGSARVVNAFIIYEAA